MLSSSTNRGDLNLPEGLYNSLGEHQNGSETNIEARDISEFQNTDNSPSNYDQESEFDVNFDLYMDTDADSRVDFVRNQQGATNDSEGYNTPDLNSVSYVNVHSLDTDSIRGDQSNISDILHGDVEWQDERLTSSDHNRNWSHSRNNRFYGNFGEVDQTSDDFGFEVDHDNMDIDDTHEHDFISDVPWRGFSTDSEAQRAIDENELDTVDEEEDELEDELEEVDEVDDFFDVDDDENPDFVDSLVLDEAGDRGFINPNRELGISPQNFVKDIDPLVAVYASQNHLYLINTEKKNSPVVGCLERLVSRVDNQMGFSMAGYDRLCFIEKIPGAGVVLVGSQVGVIAVVCLQKTHYLNGESAYSMRLNSHFPLPEPIPSGENYPGQSQVPGNGFSLPNSHLVGMELSHDKTQDIIDQLTAAYETFGPSVDMTTGAHLNAYPGVVQYPSFLPQHMRPFVPPPIHPMYGGIPPHMIQNAPFPGHGPPPIPGSIQNPPDINGQPPIFPYGAPMLQGQQPPYSSMHMQPPSIPSSLNPPNLPHPENYHMSFPPPTGQFPPPQQNMQNPPLPPQN
ncbi:hypothetical protein BB559_002773 [Furculomyces boomerangus]|uniref:Uncharacterized protein n=2 Tax=Harpellales TaxID=61421 RepID=A0A2T9YSP5_9FUNG|nr:hypothetical protein BB559_002773 [Furculomyces boomerangus]